MDFTKRKAELMDRYSKAGADRVELLPDFQGLVNDLREQGKPVASNLAYILTELEDEAREADMDNLPV